MQMISHQLPIVTDSSENEHCLPDMKKVRRSSRDMQLSLSSYWRSSEMSRVLPSTSFAGRRLKRLVMKSRSSPHHVPSCHGTNTPNKNASPESLESRHPQLHVVPFRVQPRLPREQFRLPEPRTMAPTALSSCSGGQRRPRHSFPMPETPSEELAEEPPIFSSPSPDATLPNRQPQG